MTDIAILAVVLISALVAYYRGLIRETFTIITWVGAAIIAFFLFPAARDIARGMIPVPLLADISAAALLFLAALLPIILLVATLTHQLNREGPGLIDRWAGGVFGVVRGLFLVAIVYWASLLLVRPGQEPAWIQGSLSEPIIHEFANLLPEQAPYFTDHSDSADDEEKNGDPPPAQTGAAQGYQQNDRRSLDRLITNTSEE